MASSWHRLSFTILGLVALPLACGDDGGTDSTTMAMGSTSTSTDGDTTSAMATEGDTAVATGGMDSTGVGATSTATTTAETDGVTTGVDTDAGDCLALDARQCLANEACMPIAGTPIIINDEGACLGPREFIECQPAMGCGDAITYACEMEGGTLYEFLDTCTPSGWVDCGPPPPVELLPC